MALKTIQLQMLETIPDFLLTPKHPQSREFIKQLRTQQEGGLTDSERHACMGDELYQGMLF